MKKLFLPLTYKNYDLFMSGERHHELRVDKRWCIKHCYPGRYVLLSRGYGLGNRSLGIITSYENPHITELSDEDFKAVKDVYPKYFGDMAFVHRIGIKIIEKNYKNDE